MPEEAVGLLGAVTSSMFLGSEAVIMLSPGSCGGWLAVEVSTLVAGGDFSDASGSGGGNGFEHAALFCKR